MDEQTEKVLNPYERLRFLEDRINSLTKEELSLKEFIRRGIDKRSNSEKLSNIESEEFYLIIEQECLKQAVKWFEIYYLGYLKAKEENK